jgi:hypothetical protein
MTTRMTTCLRFQNNAAKQTVKINASQSCLCSGQLTGGTARRMGKMACGGNAAGGGARTGRVAGGIGTSLRFLLIAWLVFRLAVLIGIDHFARGVHGEAAFVVE